MRQLRKRYCRLSYLVALAVATSAVLVTACALLVTACGGDGSVGIPEEGAHVEPSTTSTAGESSATSSASLLSGPVISPVPSSGPVAAETPVNSRAPVTITVLYDNKAIHPDTQAGWGFACLVEGLEQTVLFDTGADGKVLLSNMEALHIQPGDVEAIVLSHQHRDHTGGLAKITAANPDVTIYHPASFSETSLASAREAGVTLTPVTDPVSICSGLTVTRPSGSPSESALLVDTSEGGLLITGCAHPGLLEMVAAAAEYAAGPIYAVVGGFHLLSLSGGQVDRIIQGLRELGVERCAPAHCTGEAATTQMKAAFGDGFIEMGVGAIIVF